MPRKSKKQANDYPVPLLEGQRQVAERVDLSCAAMERLFVLWYGGVRAGKSFGAAHAMVRHSRSRSNCEYLIGAYTQRLALSIFTKPFQRFAEHYELNYKDNRGVNPSITVGDNIFYIYGGRDVSQDKNIQGLTLSGLLLDEYPNLHPEFLNQAEARISDKGALRIYTANKASPYHWTTLHYYQRARKGLIKAFLVDSLTADNDLIDSEFITEKESEYDDVHYQRFIANEFALDRQPLYQPQFAPAPDSGNPSISAVYSDGRVYHVLNLYSVDDGYVADYASEYAISSDASELRLGGVTLVNAERPNLARALRRAGKAVKGYESSFVPRHIEQTQTALNTGKIRIIEDDERAIRALQEYHTGGLYQSPLVRCIEVLSDYIIRRGKRNVAES